MTDKAITTGSSTAHDVNVEFYDAYRPGKDDYWRRMAAPRWRVDKYLRLIAHAAPSRLADLGCGNGALLAAIAARFPGMDLTGVDFIAGQIAANRNAYPERDWHVADLSAPPAALPAALMGRFDTLIASEIIEHLDEPAALLRNALALAAPGGLLMLSTQSGKVRETEKRVGHRRHFSAQEMTKLLADCGWEPVRVWNCGYPFHDLSKWVANLSPDAMMHRFADTAYGWREKLVCALLRFAFRFNSNRTGAQLFAIARKPQTTGASPH